jgi:hypothetical protein
MDIIALGIGNLVGSDVLILALIVTMLFGATDLFDQLFTVEMEDEYE